MGGLSFLSPGFLVGALAIAIPIVLHLFRRRNDPVVPFGAMRFVRQLPVEQARRRRLQDLLLLSLRVAALALLATSFARPYLAAQAAADGGVTVVALDVSGSMGDPQRFARARSLAEAAVAAAPAADRVAVLQFGARADTVLEPTPDRGAARDAIARAKPTYAPTRYQAALARALEIIAGHSGRIVLVSDLQASGWTAADAAALPGRITLGVRDVGPMPPNAGIAAVERTGDGIRVGVASSGAARGVDVQLTVDGALIGRMGASLPADGTAEVIFRGAGQSRGVAVASLAAPDGVPADDQRWLVLDPRANARAAIVASPGAEVGDAVYVRRALESAERPHAWHVEVLQADRLRGTDDLANVAVVIVVGTSGLDRRGAEALRRFVEQGGGMLVAIGPAVNVELLGAGLGTQFPRVRVGPAADVPRSLVPTDPRHPIFRLFDPEAGTFDQARFTRIATVATTAPASVIARFDDGAAALVDQAMGRGRLGIFASDLGNRWNDLVLQPAFVPWIVETAAWLAGNRTAPGGITVGDSALSGTDRPGVVDWRPVGAPATTSATRVAVNPEMSEFDARRLDQSAFLAQVARDEQDSAGRPAQARRQESEQRWWQYGLVLMLVGLVVESAIGRRG